MIIALLRQQPQAVGSSDTQKPSQLTTSTLRAQRTRGLLAALLVRLMPGARASGMEKLTACYSTLPRKSRANLSALRLANTNLQHRQHKLQPHVTLHLLRRVLPQGAPSEEAPGEHHVGPSWWSARHLVRLLVPDYVWDAG